MKNKRSTQKTIIIVAIIISIIILIGWLYLSYKNNISESPDIITLNQGTQANFENLYIGLSSINNNSAWLSIHQDGNEGSTNKQVIAGDTIEVYGYEIEIKSVNKKYNFSIKPGSSQGNIKFIVTKQK